MITAREMDILGCECITNTQSNTIIHNKTQTDIHGEEDQLNKEALKKPMIQ